MLSVQLLIGQDDEAVSKLSYIGSSTVGNFIQDANQHYESSQFTINTKSESAGGELAIIEGRTDLAGIARRPNENVLNRGVASKLIGWDAIAVITHPQNPVKNLTQSQLKLIFTGAITNWKEVGGEDREIVPYVVGIESATRRVFRSIILGADDYHGCIEINPDAHIINEVSIDRGGIGHISYSFLENVDKVQAIHVNGQKLSLSNNRYPITRPLYLLWWPGRKDVANFVDWTMTREGQRIIMKRFIGASEAVIQSESSSGTLIVYTETNTIEDGGMFYYPHKPYEILDQNREIIMKVKNHLSRNDENPTPVELSPGYYLIRLNGNDDQSDELFVNIEAGKTTKFNAYKNASDAQSGLDDQNIIKPSAAIAETFAANEQLLTVYGDFRVRGEQDFRTTSDRFRGRFRIRAGMSTRIGRDAKFDLRLVSTTDPNDPNSSHVEIDNGFNQIQVAIDRAYFQLHPDKIPSLNWLIGKFSNPNISSNIYSEVVWDADIQPEGTAFSWESQGGSGKSTWQLTNGSYLISQFSEGNQKNWLNNTQLAWRGKLAADWNFTLASNMYYFANIKDLEIGESFLDANEGNSTYMQSTSIDNEEIITHHYATDFHILENFALLQYNGLKMPLMLKIEWLKNFGAEESNTGTVWGISYGDLRTKGQWKVFYQYQHIETDAIFTPYAQDDFLSRTNSNGHVISAAYNVHRLVSVQAWALLDSQIQGELLSQSRFRLDLNVKF